MGINRKAQIFIAALILLGALVVGAFLKRGDSPSPNTSSGEYDHTEYSIDGSGSIYIVKGENVYKDGSALNGSEADKILRLHGFYKWNTEDPLLFSLSLDPKEFEASLESIRKGEKELVDLVGWSSGIPLNFMDAFKSSSQAGREFKNNASEKNALNLLSKQEEVLNSYAKDVDHLSSLISSAKSTGILSGSKYAALGGETYTSFEIIEDDFKIIRSNISALKKELEKRRKCLTENYSFCEGKEFAIKDVKKAKDSPANLLPKEYLGLDGYSLRGPYRIDSECWQEPDPKYIYIADYCDKDFGCMKEMHLATGRYFTKLGDYFPFDKFFKEKGLEVIPQNATTPYDCNNLEYYGSISSLDKFISSGEKIFTDPKNSAKLDSLSEDDKKLWDKGAEYEKDIFLRRFPEDKTLDALGEIYGYFYEVYFGKDNISRLFLDQHLKISENIYGTPPVASRFGAYLWGFVQPFKYIEPKPNKGYVHAIRSGYSFTFLSFSPTMWRSSTKPTYLMQDPELRGESDSIMTDDIARKMYGEANLAKWVDEFRKYDKIEFYRNYRE